MTRTCVTLSEATAACAVSLARRCRSFGADLVEVRMDHHESPFWGKAHQDEVRSMGLGTILTLRPEWEGGHYHGGEEERAASLSKALESVPDHIDLELGMDGRTRDRLAGEARARGTSVIVSHHDMTCTPSLDEMRDILGRCLAAGADIVKLSFMCTKAEDSLAVMELAEIASVMGARYAIMGMGPYGQMTRAFAPILGCEIVYATLDGPGTWDQIHIRTLRRIWALIEGGGNGRR